MFTATYPSVNGLGTLISVHPISTMNSNLLQLDLAVCFEMTLQNLSAQLMYYEAITDLESALTEYAATPPSWLRGLCHAPCTSWDYPKLVWSQLSWQYLAGVRSCSSPLLHVRTFFLSRLSHLLFTLGRAWSVSELVISTLHCMAREITTLQVRPSCPYIIYI